MFGWAVGSHGTSVMVGAITFYLLFYMTDSLGISVLVASQLIFFVRMYDLVTDLIMGHISDRTNTRIGRRRPYLLLGAITCFASFVALFNLPVMSSEMLTTVVIGIVLVILLRSSRKKDKKTLNPWLRKQCAWPWHRSILQSAIYRAIFRYILI